MIDLLCRVGSLDEVEELIDKMRSESNEILVFVYCFLLSVVWNYGNLEVVEWVVEKLKEVEVSDLSVYILLVSVYVFVNRW